MITSVKTSDGICRKIDFTHEPLSLAGFCNSLKASNLDIAIEITRFDIEIRKESKLDSMTQAIEKFFAIDFRKPFGYHDKLVELFAWVISQGQVILLAKNLDQYLKSIHVESEVKSALPISHRRL